MLTPYSTNQLSFRKCPIVLMLTPCFCAALRSPAKSLTFSGLNGNYHQRSVSIADQLSGGGMGGVS